MTKPNFQRWEAEYRDNRISVTNWWNWSLQGSADLYINAEVVFTKELIQSKEDFEELYSLQR